MVAAAMAVAAMAAGGTDPVLIAKAPIAFRRAAIRVAALLLVGALAMSSLAMSPLAMTSAAFAQGFIDPAALSVPETGTFELSLLSDKTSYHPKDNMVLIVLAQEACKLTLADVDSTGDGTVLFPNKLQPNNAIEAGKVLVIGDRASPIRLVAGDTESHTIVAQCVTASGSLVRKTIKLEVN
jgi:hypothetical protein